MNQLRKNFVEPFTQYQGLPREVYILALQRFITALGSFVYPFLTMLMTQKLGMSTAAAGFWVLMSSVVSMVGSLMAGSLIDRYNRKNIMVISKFIGAMALFFCGFIEPSMLTVHIIILQSFISSFSNPASTAMMSDLTKPENRKQSFSLLYLCMNAAGAISYTLAGYLFNHYWRMLFIGDAVTTIISLIPLILFVSESKPTKDEISELETSDRINEKEAKGNMLSALLQRPYLLCFVLINSLIGFVYSQSGFLMPLQLSEIFGSADGAKNFGMLMSINTIVVILFTPFILNITKEIKPIINVFFATIFYIVGFGMMAFINSLSLFIVSVIIWTLGEILHSVNTGVYIANHSPINQRGRFSSIVNIINFAGKAAAPSFMGVYLMTNETNSAWILVAFTAAISSVSLIILNLVEVKNRRW